MKTNNKVLHTEYTKKCIAIYTIKGVQFEIYASPEIRLLEALFLWNKICLHSIANTLITR